MWTNLHFGIVFSGHWYIAEAREQKKICRLTLLLSIHSIPHCHSFLSFGISCFPSLSPFYSSICIVFRTFVRLSGKCPLDERFWWRKRSIYWRRRRARMKGTVNGANETVDWTKTNNQSSKRNSSRSGSSNKRTKSIDLFTTCPSALYIDGFQLCTTHSFYLIILYDIRTMCQFDELAVVVTLYSILCYYVVHVCSVRFLNHNIPIYRNIDSEYMCMCACWFDRREKKELSITNFPFHSFASFTLLISFTLCTNKHIDGRMDRRMDGWTVEHCKNMVCIQNSLVI